MSEMVDRVAKALDEKLKEFDVFSVRSEVAAALAVVAVAAMREPTEAMIDAALNHPAAPCDAPPGIWRTMIDAALNPS